MVSNHHSQKSVDSLGLRIGPLQYLLFAYCSWGEDILQRLRLHLSTMNSPCHDKADRLIHLVDGHSGDLSAQDLRSRLAQDLAELTWQPVANRINTLWFAGHSRHVIWSKAAAPELGRPRFDLPWSLLIEDITSRSGGLVHAGLACHKEAGVLFLAPPTGGKTTTLNTAPADWQVLSDDAALVWPGAKGRWLASPLPAWGSITNPDRDWPDEPVALDASCRLKSLLVLEKSPQLSFNRITASSAMPHLYRALSEYPVTIICAASHEESWFRSAARICRELLCWQLCLPLHADIWPMIAGDAA